MLIYIVSFIYNISFFGHSVPAPVSIKYLDRTKATECVDRAENTSSVERGSVKLDSIYCQCGDYDFEAVSEDTVRYYDGTIHGTIKKTW